LTNDHAYDGTDAVTVNQLMPVIKLALKLHNFKFENLQSKLQHLISAASIITGTTEAIARINHAITAATKKPLGFVNLFASDITKPTTELPETLMYWMLLGYLPKHIDPSLQLS
jgi:hypothetical protein